VPRVRWGKGVWVGASVWACVWAGGGGGGGGMVWSRGSVPFINEDGKSERSATI